MLYAETIETPYQTHFEEDNEHFDYFLQDADLMLQVLEKSVRDCEAGKFIPADVAFEMLRKRRAERRNNSVESMKF